MNEYLQVSTTTGDRHDAERIATELVSRRLAACVQVSGPINSTYRWQGKVETAEEWLCVAKTERPQLAAIQQLIHKLHPYEVPEIIATPIIDGSPAYLAWLSEQIDNAQRS